MKVKITSKKHFENANFIMIDSFKFLSSGLDKLCKSFKLPRNIRKSKMDHNMEYGAWKT